MPVTTPQVDLIPVLDLAPLATGQPSDVEALGRQLRHALQEVGFFFIINHGIPWSAVEKIYGRARELHALPHEEKETFPMDGDHGGYLSLGGGTSYASDIAGEVRKPNQNEAFFVHEGGYRLSNRFPNLEGFEETTGDYMRQVQGLALSMLPVLASSLDLEPGYFAPHFELPSVTLRMSHYPVMDYTDNEWGLAPHTDSSIFTFLPANDIPGLQIRPVPCEQRRHAEAVDQPSVPFDGSSGSEHRWNRQIRNPVLLRRQRRRPDRSGSHVGRSRPSGA